MKKVMVTQTLTSHSNMMQERLRQKVIKRQKQEEKKTEKEHSKHREGKEGEGGEGGE